MQGSLPTMNAPFPQLEEEHAAPPIFTLREVAVFGSIVSIILLSANALVCVTWSYFFRLPGWIVWQLVPGALAIAFIPATILRFRSSDPALRIVYALSASWLGALNFFFFASVACWIVEAIVSMTAWPLSRSSIGTVLFGLALMATVYGLINAACIRTTRVRVKLPNLPEAWQGRTAALLTDLHLGPLSGPGFLRRVLARLRILKPAVIFISGDMFDGPTHGLDALVAPWSEFSAPRGVFYVTGNHDEFAERSLYLEPVGRVGIRVLNNEKTSLDGLQIIGVHDSEAENLSELRSILRQVQIDQMQASILLAHRPVNLSVAEEEGISLQLSGHTHGGQIWPWNLLVARIYGRFGHGLSRLGGLQVYTSYGVGTWGPPLRVGTKSEIVLIQFENEVAQG
jgi:predicted MPP superfamily phosphohydrolase